MDSGVLIILALISLGLVFGALLALWWRSRRKTGTTDYYIDQRLGPAPQPERGSVNPAPPPPPQPSRPPAPQGPHASPGQPPPPPAGAAPGFGGIFEREKNSDTKPVAPAAPPAPIAPAQPIVPPAPPLPVAASPVAEDEDTGAFQRDDFEQEKPATRDRAREEVAAPPITDHIPAVPKPAPEPADEAEEETKAAEPLPTEMPDWQREAAAEEAAEPVPELPLLDLDELPADALADFMKDTATASPVSGDTTQTGAAKVDIQSLSRAAQSVLFSAYYPKEVVPEQWEKLHAYVFRAMAAAAVEKDANEQIGPRMADFRGVRAPAKADVPEGALITATPQMEGFQFNPPSISLGFYKDWHRFDFEVRAKGAPLNQATNGLLTFTVEGIIVADVPLSIYVGETVSPSSRQANAVAKLYHAIFCSYSHQDQHVVARAERAYKALGLDYLRDVMSLKSGQDWSEELLNLINKADVFQLFWSHAAAKSEHVRYEWEHALQVAGWRENFIRPVYWQEPKPEIPAELKHIHFAYQPDLAE